MPMSLCVLCLTRLQDKFPLGDNKVEIEAEVSQQMPSDYDVLTIEQLFCYIFLHTVFVCTN